MRRRLLLLPVLLLLAASGLAACGDDDAAVADATEEESSSSGPEEEEEAPAPGSEEPGGEEPTGGGAAVTIAGFAFDPDPLEVAAGTAVTVTNDDTAPHTWTADDGSFDSGQLGQGDTFEHTFEAAGQIAVHCEIHPTMKGTVTVT